MGIHFEQATQTFYLNSKGCSYVFGILPAFPEGDFNTLVYHFHKV